MYVNAPYEKFMNIPDGISSKIMVCLASLLEILFKMYIQHYSKYTYTMLGRFYTSK